MTGKIVCITCALLGLLVWLPGSSISQPAPAWSPEDILEVQELGSPALSPDGKWVVFTVREAVAGPETSRYLTHLWLASADGSRSFRLTSGKESCTQPAWAPEGDRISYLCSRETGTKNVWLTLPDGSQAARLTEAAEDIESYAWSPDGRRIAFLMDDPLSDERRQAEKSKDDALVVGREPRYRHIHVVRTDASRMPAEAQRLTGGEFSVDSFVWSPDGGRLAFVRHPTPLIYEWRNSDLYTVSSEGGEPRPLVADPGMDTAPLFSPDGKTVAFVSDRGNLCWARDWRVCLVPAEGGDVRVLQATFDRMPGRDITAGLAAWAPDGSGVYYSESMRTETGFFFLPADGGSFRRVDTGPGGKSDFFLLAGLDTLTFVGQDLDLAPEIYIQAGTETARPVTSINSRLKDKPLSESRVIGWKSFDGLEIEGILYFPSDHRREERFPLLVELHGGPTWLFTRSYNVPSQVFTHHGFGVLKVNFRGSSGYGRDFRFSNLGDWGGKDLRDALAGVDHLIGEGLADPERLGVFGWSYGGFLTSMTVSRTRRFKAAVEGAGITDLVSFAGTTDITGFIPSFLQTEFWEAPELWRDRSAVFHAADITTPVLILHGELDKRVPVGQGYEFYQALKQAGATVEMAVYPRTEHDPDEPKLDVDILRRQLEWFLRYVR